MAISLVGVLPVAALNIGVVAGIPALTAKITQLGIDLSKLGLSAEAQLTVSLNIPQLPSLALGYAAYLSAFPENFDPAKIFNASADYQLEAAAELGIIEAQIAIVGDINADFQAGLDAGGLSLWTYAGNAAAFGTQLQAQTQTGYPGVEPNETINALIIATESFESWGSFSATFNTGTTSSEKLESTDSADLTFEGTLDGGQLNTGVLDLSLPIELFLLELEAAKLNLLASLDIALGINLPDLDLLLGAALNVDLQLMLENLVNVNVDLLAEIRLIRLQIDFLFALILELQGTLSAGGLAFWTYSGPAANLGSEFAAEVENGIPGGNGSDVASYGCVVATKLPAAWASFGLIFATG